jgi:hypothetical protein
MKIPSEVINIDRAVRALRYHRPRASGRMPLHLDEIYHAVVGLREAIRAKWEPEMQEYWVRDLAQSLEHWRLAREEVEHDE